MRIPDRVRDAAQLTVAALSLAALVILAWPALGEESAEEQHMRRGEPRPAPRTPAQEWRGR